MVERIIESKNHLLCERKVPNDVTTQCGDTYTWSWLPLTNVQSLLKIRNAGHVLGHMRNKSPITEEMHLDFLQKYESLPRIDFILQHHDSGKYVGAVNISLTDYGFEIGKYIGNEKFLGKGIAFPMTQNFLTYIDENVSEISEIRAVTKITNYKNINLNFKLGFQIIESVENDYWLMELR